MSRSWIINKHKIKKKNQVKNQTRIFWEKSKGLFIITHKKQMGGTGKPMKRPQDERRALNGMEKSVWWHNNPSSASHTCSWFSFSFSDLVNLFFSSRNFRGEGGGKKPLFLTSLPIQPPCSPQTNPPLNQLNNSQYTNIINSKIHFFFESHFWWVNRLI